MAPLFGRPHFGFTSDTTNAIGGGNQVAPESADSTSISAAMSKGILAQF